MDRQCLEPKRDQKPHQVGIVPKRNNVAPAYLLASPAFLKYFLEGLGLFICYRIPEFAETFSTFKFKTQEDLMMIKI